ASSEGSPAVMNGTSALRPEFANASNFRCNLDMRFLTRIYADGRGQGVLGSGRTAGGLLRRYGNGRHSHPEPVLALSAFIRVNPRRKIKARCLLAWRW